MHCTSRTYTTDLVPGCKEIQNLENVIIIKCVREEEKTKQNRKRKKEHSHDGDLLHTTKAGKLRRKEFLKQLPESSRVHDWSNTF